MELFNQISYTVEILLGALVFLRVLPRRKHFALRFLGAVTVSLAMGLGISPFRNMGEMQNLISLQVTIVVVTLSMWFVFESYFAAILSACVAGVAAQHIGHHISRLFSWFPGIPHWSNQLEFLCVSVVYLLLCVTLGRRLRIQNYFANTDIRITIVSLVIVLVCTGITRLLRLIGEQNFYITAATSFYAITCCVLALFFEFFLYNNLRSESEYRLLQRIHDEERRQYEISKENSELLNIKYHDLKHTLVALKNQVSQQELDSMQSILDTYGNQYCTGNSVLDIILNEKILHSQSKGVTITCMGSGKCLDFVDALDIYSMFGNLLENAIAAVRRISDPKKRVVSMVIESKGDLIYIDIMNFFQGSAPSFQDGLPVTSKKEEPGYHGYGLKSVRTIAHKYNGDLSIEFKDGIFAAHIYLMATGVN